MQYRSPLHAWTISVALTGFCGGCGASDEPRETGRVQAGGTRHNLLLITLDTTRTDHLGCYGADGANTPAIDSLAARGALFEEAHSPAPMTLPAHATMLTGVLPPEHGARVNGEHRLGEELPTLPEQLSAAGYRTGAFIAAFVLNHRFGLNRGFDHYDDELTGAYEQEVPSGLARYRPGNLVVDAALNWLEKGKPFEPFFAWVHLYDAHYPWFSHEPGEAAPIPGSGTYAGEIAFMDRQVARLLSFLEQRGITDRTVVVALADHGEGLGDHGEIEHAYLLNEEVLHVPWIVAGPGVKSGHRIPALVTLEDLWPTVSELLGLPAPELRGRNLAAALRGEAIESGVAYAETDLPWTAYRWAPQRSLTTAHWKYIRTPQAELYDRTSDRDEQINLVEVKPTIRAALEEELTQIQAQRVERRSESASLSSEEIEQLAELGYTVSSGETEAPKSGEQSLADVKERLAAKSLCARLREGLAKEALEPAVVLEMARELVRMSPETPEFHEHLGTALVHVGEIDPGIQELELAVSLDPANAGAHYSLGDVLQQQGQTAKAKVHLERALELEPKMAAAHVGMGNVLRAEGRADLAAGRYTEALSLREGRYPEAHYNLALTYVDRSNPQKASEHFLLAIGQKPGWAIAHASLANLYANWGKGSEAIEQYQIAIELAPDDAGLRDDFAVVLDASARRDDAREQLLEAVRLAPDFFRPHVHLARQAFDAGDDEAALKEYEEALRLAPGSAEPTARLARFLATCPDEAFRDAARAVALAERAADLAGPSPRVLDTLAAAHAAAGDYPKAVSIAHRAQQLAQRDGDGKLAHAIEARIALYALEKPYLEPRSPGAGGDNDEGQR